MFKIVVNGAAQIGDVPGLELIEDRHELVFADSKEALAAALPGAEVVMGYNFKGRDLPDCWPHADSLKWIHWCGAGVDAVLFPELVQSDVTLTNARGCFDRAMAEYVLGMMLIHAKGFGQLHHDIAIDRQFADIAVNVVGHKALKKFAYFVLAVTPEARVPDEGAIAFPITQEATAAAIGGDHTLFHKFL